MVTIGYVVLLCRGDPYMCGYVFPWTIWRVPYFKSKFVANARVQHVLCNLVPDRPHMFLPTMPQCHMHAKKCLHHPCLLRVPMVGKDQYGYITPTF